LAIGVLANVVNVIADYALIFGRLGAPELGAVGSAWATGIAFLFAMLVIGVLWWRDDLLLPWTRWRSSVTRQLSWRLLRVGIPTAFEQLAFSGGLLIFLGIVSEFGTPPVSAYMIGVRILSFCFVPGVGFAMAASTIVGQNLGADRPEQAARLAWRGMRGAVGVMGLLGLTIVFFARPLADLFGAVGDETIALTVVFIYILGAAQPLMAIEFALGGALRGAGDTRFPLIAILVGLFAFRLGAAVLIAAPLFGTVTAVWCCLLADYAVKAALLSWRFASGRWKTVKV
jgi:putative MATE family efflux protein